MDESQLIVKAIINDLDINNNLQYLKIIEVFIGHPGKGKNIV